MGLLAFLPSYQNLTNLFFENDDFNNIWTKFEIQSYETKWCHTNMLIN